MNEDVMVTCYAEKSILIDIFYSGLYWEEK